MISSAKDRREPEGVVMGEQRSYQDRHAAALEVLTTMTGGKADAERSSRAMVRHMGALGSFAVDNVMGDLWSRTQLSRRDRSLVVVTFLATQGRDEELEAHIEIGLQHGLTRSEIEEIVIQVAGYAGFPAAMSATRHVDAVFCRLDGVERQPERSPAASKDDAQRSADAMDVLHTLFAGRAASDPAEALAGMQTRLGDVGTLAFNWAFGEIWSRTELSRRDRSLVVVSILAALSRAEELAVHVPGALNHGVTRVEVEEVMVQLALYGGFPRAVEGIKAAKAAFAKIDARG